MSISSMCSCQKPISSAPISRLPSPRSNLQPLALACRNFLILGEASLSLFPRQFRGLHAPSHRSCGGGNAPAGKIGEDIFRHDAFLLAAALRKPRDSRCDGRQDDVLPRCSLLCPACKGGSRDACSRCCLTNGFVLALEASSEV